MKWVTWQNIGVDRMACAWWIRNHIDPQAEFLFIPAGLKPLPDGAELFDIPGTRHRPFRGLTVYLQVSYLILLTTV